MAIKPGRPVAMGIIGGTPFIGLPGNPVASFVTFVHVVRPTVLALAGAAQQPLVPLPVRAAFSYKKKSRRREYVRVSLRKGDDGGLEAVKFPREGAGLLSSLVDTDGLVELGDDVTRVEPGADGRVSWLCEPDVTFVSRGAAVDDAAPLRHFSHDHDKTRSHRPKMSVAGAEDTKGAEGADARRHAGSSLHRSAVGDRYSRT